LPSGRGFAMMVRQFTLPDLDVADPA
jgi:hypothetical protein